MERAQSKLVFNFLARRQVIFIVFAITVSVFSSTQVPARDQDYLDTINAEAQDLGEVGNTDINESVTTPPANDSQPEHSSNDQSTFIQQIHSQLFSNGDNESAYLKQLENEVQDLSDSAAPSTSANQNNKSKQNKDGDLTTQRNKVIQITEAQRKEMEIALETKIPGIYRLYKKLGLTQKRLVVKEYLKNHKISTASKSVLNLYGGKSSF
jgi:hypothetical protein